MAVNVYQKLQKARVELQKQPLKESGNNTFAKYTYMELGDFLPQINAICAEVGLCGVVSFGKEEATLTLVNVETPEEKVVFASPMSTAELKGCHAVQQLGAVQSYLRRYLWVAAFEIVEHDALDATTGKKEATGGTQQQRQQGQHRQQPASDLATEQQTKLIFAKMKDHGVSGDALKAEFKIASSKEIKKSHVNDILAWLDKQQPSLCNDCRQPVNNHAPSCPQATPPQ